MCPAGAPGDAARPPRRGGRLVRGRSCRPGGRSDPPADPPDRRRSWFVYVVRLADHFPADARDRVMHALQADGIGCAPYFPCIHLQPYYRRRFGYRPGAFPVAERVAARTLALPFYPDLTRDDVRRVARALKAALGALHAASSTR
ncbi:hypothetical protein AWN76_009240 [Rhodothermaceae bacterium RA]|nr:hypothetical protein AWN76_009240 [Rhodothermaceae bacterium RA]